MTREGAIAAWLPEARWFAGKGSGPVRVVIHDAATIPGTPLEATLIDVAEDNGPARYWIARDGAADAAASPEFSGWVVGMALGDGRLPGRVGTFRGHTTTAGERPPAAGAAVTVSSLGGDASNTSLLVGLGPRLYAVKLLRRCRAGIQPEVEVGRFLANVGWQGTPRLCGWLDYAPATGDATALATVHEFAAGRRSAWDELVCLAGDGGLSGRHGEAIIGLAAALGRATAEMHRALACRADVAAFAPERPAHGWAKEEADRMADHAARVFDLAAARLPKLPSEVANGLLRLAARRPTIEAVLRGLETLHDAAALIRVHGDFHLGQVLVGESEPRVLVIDFEGEPGRSLEDRRRKTSVFKDVAGMCRSFDYLLRHVARAGDRAYQPDDLARLKTAYLEAYRAVARGQAWWPADQALADALLAVFALDKALYELAYEITNRPDWVEVPLSALLSQGPTTGSTRRPT